MLIICLKMQWWFFSSFLKKWLVCRDSCLLNCEVVCSQAAGHWWLNTDSSSAFFLRRWYYLKGICLNGVPFFWHYILQVGSNIILSIGANLTPRFICPCLKRAHFPEWPAGTNFVVKSVVTLPPNPSANMAWLRSAQRLNQCRMPELLQKTKYTNLFLTLEPFSTLGEIFFASQMQFSLRGLWCFLDNWNAIPWGTLCGTKCSVTAWLMCIHN